MLLALTLAALAPQTVPNPDERACIVEALPADQRVNLAERFIAGEMDMMLMIVEPAADSCAAKWKWDIARREWHVVHSASVAAMLRLESQLPGEFTPQRLEALFLQLPEADRYGFSLSGSAELAPEAYTALVQRAGALLATQKLSDAQIETAGRWFIAYARYAEAQAQLIAGDKPG